MPWAVGTGASARTSLCLRVVICTMGGGSEQNLCWRGMEGSAQVTMQKHLEQFLAHSKHSAGASYYYYNKDRGAKGPSLWSTK